MTSDPERIAAVALAEDGESDVTTALTVPPDLDGVGRLEFRSGGVVAGAAYADAVARACECRLEWRAPDGRAVPPGTVVGIVHGPLHRILRAERPMLNLLQRACGIASATRAYVDAVAGTACRILHTRKTAPGLRALDVAAVLSGGGTRHRLDLSHEVMVKDNHWQALRVEGNDLTAALARARARGITSLQVEVESIQQVEDACAAGATRLLVDNQAPTTVRAWAERARELVSKIEIEATGGITLENVRAYAEAGVDFVSIGALTHSVVAADIGLEVGVRSRESATRP
ncbi:MAG TPA: carboxylating nicotinate-nucleotide diphosphorylase [Gemmatimonadales bacterium]|nr:carboxylating nicotinate-nucleotide diphosphorylase [Gemmatimonadales bacterium]